MSSSGVRAALTGIASYLPEGRLTNEQLTAEFADDWTPEKIKTKTGIDSRHVARSDEFTSDLAVQAAENLFARWGGRREEIDLVLLLTVSPDYILPFTAGAVQAALELPTSVGAMDITLACSGYPYGLSLAAGMIESGRVRRVLLLTGDRFTTYTKQAERGSKTLFGDAATASMLEATENGTPAGGIVRATRYGTDGRGEQNLIIPTSAMKGFVGKETTQAEQPTFQMNGPEVFDFAIKVIAKHVKDFLAAEELKVDDVDLFIFHQANLFMISHLQRRLRIPDERFVVHLSEVGNTAASSIPLALESAVVAERVKPGSRVVLVGFGTGYSWSSVVLEYTG